MGLFSDIRDADRFHPIEIVVILGIDLALRLRLAGFRPGPLVRLSVSISVKKIARLVMTAGGHIPPFIRRLVFVTKDDQGTVIDARFVLISQDKDFGRLAELGELGFVFRNGAVLGAVVVTIQ